MFSKSLPLNILHFAADGNVNVSMLSTKYVQNIKILCDWLHIAETIFWYLWCIVWDENTSQHKRWFKLAPASSSDNNKIKTSALGRAPATARQPDFDTLPKRHVFWTPCERLQCDILFPPCGTHSDLLSEKTCFPFPVGGAMTVHPNFHLEMLWIGIWSNMWNRGVIGSFAQKL